MQKHNEAPPWVWLLIGVAILGYVGWRLIPVVHCHYTGKESVAVVTKVTWTTEGGGINPEETPRRVAYYTLAFDGKVASKRGGGRTKQGDQFPVIYLDGDPSSVVRGSRKGGLWATIKKNTNETKLGIIVSIGIFLLLAGTRKSRDRDASEKSWLAR